MMIEPTASASQIPESASPFYGVGATSKFHSRRRCQLLLVSNPLVNHVGDFEAIRNTIAQFDPKVRCHVLASKPQRILGSLLSLARPTLAISMVPVARFRPLRGCFLHGIELGKARECAALEKAGFPVPKWQIIQPDEDPDLSDYGPYVVTKPDSGMRGALVKIKKKGRVRYKPHAKISDEPGGRMAAAVQSDARMLAQEFIYTGSWPISYRVTTLFGKVLYSFKVEASHERVGLPGPDAFGSIPGDKGVSIVASSRGCVMTLNYDEEIIRLGEAAAAVFPDIPLLGFDIIREVPSGKLYILEANAIGYVWHFSAPMGLGMQRDNNINFDSQFDGLRKAAHILAAKTQELAR